MWQIRNKNILVIEMVGVVGAESRDRDGRAATGTSLPAIKPRGDASHSERGHVLLRVDKRREFAHW
jgi:hypothetical protein